MWPRPSASPGTSTPATGSPTPRPSPASSPASIRPAAPAAGNGCSANAPAAPAAQTQRAVKLADRHWDGFNKAQIEKLLLAYGKTSPNYNPAKPLPPLRTYQLGDVRVYDAQGRLDADNTLQKDRIARALDTALAERGISPLAQQADVQVSVEVEQREVIPIDPRPRVSIGVGRGIYPGWGMGWQQPVARDDTEGRLRVDLLADGALRCALMARRADCTCSCNELALSRNSVCCFCKASSFFSSVSSRCFSCTRRPYSLGSLTPCCCKSVLSTS